MTKWLFGLSFSFLIYNLYFIIPAQAVVDPLAVSNNRFGIHIISPNPQEASDAAQLVNTNGDWGYLTLLIEDGDRNISKWQTFFNELRRRHLIPIVRLATHSDGGTWVKPSDGQENGWAEFLNNLTWPTKNRYVVIFNEPNHGKEWGNSVDAKSYALTLDKYITALKSKNDDFFVINAGLDASAPQQLPNYEDEAQFLTEMNQTVPGIFDKLDGWSSHSYPNPDFSSSPNASGRGSIRTWAWEKQYFRTLGVKKDLPVFITETGWKHAEGLKTINNYPSAATVTGYFKTAFDNAWNNPRIIAVTPFLLSYQEEPFDHFSFKKITGEKQKDKLNLTSYQLQSENVLGTQFPEFYPQFEQIRNLPKQSGKPVQENKAQLMSSNFSSSIALNEQYSIEIKLKNTGQSIWGENGPIRLIPTQGGSEFGIEGVTLPDGVKVEPNWEYTFIIKLKATTLGEHSGTLALFNGEQQFNSDPFTFTANTKSPVILVINSKLAWKNSSAGEYLISFVYNLTKTVQKVVLGTSGQSNQVQIHNLLPDTSYNFTVQKPYYESKSIIQTVRPGVNTLDFGELQPDIPSAILNPPELWKLLPLSN